MSGADFFSLMRGRPPVEECFTTCFYMIGIHMLPGPEIIFTEGENEGVEGCLSVPGKWGIVTRPNAVRVKAQDRFGRWFETEGEDLTGRCFCHELEHLDGHLYTEHIDRFLTEEELADYYREMDDETEDDAP